MTIVLREATPADASALVALWDDAYAPGRSPDGAGVVERALCDDHLVCIVAELSGRMVGSLLAGFDGWRGNLYRLAVAPEQRRRGVARALVARAERVLGDLGASRLTAIVDGSNDPAQQFWAAHGYHRDPDAVRFVGATPG